MNKNTKTADEEKILEDALSPLVNRLIDKNYETSKDKIASQMAPLIGSAIREQIKSQKDDVVDALYPVMGNMISKYVTQSLEDILNKINTQIQNGLSVETLKRKLKAKIKGVSETELLLSEITNSKVKAVLLIHKETGIVLTHLENKNHTLNEPEMLASMMTAIRSFVNDWVEQNGSNQELGEIDYGGNKIIIEASGHSYLAVIIEGAAYKSTYDVIRTTMQNIVLHHGNMIQEFQGDTSTLDEEALKADLLPLLQYADDDTATTRNTQEKKKIHPLLYIIPLLLVAYGSYSYYKSYTNTQLQQKIETRLDSIPSLMLYKIQTEVDDGVVTLKGVVPFEYHKHLAQQSLQNIKDIKEIHNDLKVVPTLQDPMQVSSNIAYLLDGLNTQEGVGITYTYDYNTLTLNGSVFNPSQKEQILEKIKKIEEIKNIKDNIKVIPPKLSETLYFKKNKTQLTQELKKQLTHFAISLSHLDTSYPLKITLYSDTLGSPKKNEQLSKKRLQNIKDFLQKELQVKNDIITSIKNTPPPGIDAKKYPYKARCATISLIDKDQYESSL